MGSEIQNVLNGLKIYIITIVRKCIPYDDDDGGFLSLGTNIIGYDVFLLLLSLAINVW